jgi:AcrR family transcriptional regulator
MSRGEAQRHPAPSRPRRRATGKARREQILLEAMECFAENGFRGTTTRLLAKRVGITEAALYRYFSSKESLYQAIVDRKMREPELVAFLAPAAERRDDRAVFGGLARELFRRIEEDPAFLRILFFTALENHALSEPFFASRVRRLREFVAGYVALRVEEGAFRSVEPALAARAFLGMIFDHMNVRIIFHQKETYQQTLDEVADTFTSIFLGGVQQPSEGKAP